MGNNKKTLPPEFDANLWFEHLGCRGRHYLLGNPHTVPGRMQAWCPREGVSVFVSRNDIGRASRAARYWIEGYLHGNEPAPPAGRDGPPDFGSATYRRWQRDTASFRASGTWPSRGGRSH
jgi:hypothetical protein